MNYEIEEDDPYCVECCGGDFVCGSCAEEKVGRLKKEIKKLQEEVCELLEEAFREIAHYGKDGERKGWWDTMARSTAVDYGDRLVELGKWERHPDGVGRRWWYRPIELMEKSDRIPRS